MNDGGVQKGFIPDMRILVKYDLRDTWLHYWEGNMFPSKPVWKNTVKHCIETKATNVREQTAAEKDGCRVFHHIHPLHLTTPLNLNSIAKRNVRIQNHVMNVVCLLSLYNESIRVSCVMSEDVMSDPRKHVFCEGGCIYFTRCADI